MHHVASKIIASSVADAQLDPAPIPEEDVISGDPQSSMAILWRSDDLKLYNGIWECTPGVFTLKHPGETVCCVRGRATITPEGGEAVTLGPGDMAFIPEGTVARWEVHETIRKAFHSHDSTGTLIAGL